MEEKVILEARDLEDFLTQADRDFLQKLGKDYDGLKTDFTLIEEEADGEAQERIQSFWKEMGSGMKEFISKEERLKVYGFDTPSVLHGEASRLIAKLRDVRTGPREFVYYIQRAYEMLFNLAFAIEGGREKHNVVVRTPVNQPFPNFAVHRIPTLDAVVENTVMCVLLRGALLPSMIVSKEIQEFSSSRLATPFALFRISRNDEKSKKDMEYILNLEKSYFDLESLDGKDLVFADPMNATGGSMVTIIKYLESRGVRPRSIKVLNVISALRGALNLVRAVDNLEVYTLWMDPVLNEKAYIMPGLGDAGDRLNGSDDPNLPRNILQLLADYGTSIIELYRDQVRNIEQTILG